MVRVVNRVLPGPVIFIVGPTATGKTRLAVKLAKRLGGEIISCDSMQAYKGMSILSQAPSADEVKKIRHHLVGCIEPSREYSVAVFIKKATSLIAAIIKKNKVPIVVGGSGLYMKALVDGLFPSPKTDVKFRREMQAFVSRYSSRRLHAKLLKIDPQAARAIHPNDARRIIRALEVYHSTGRTMTELKANTKGLKDRYEIKIFALTMTRKKIYAAIDSRVDRMFAGGLLREVRKLKKKRLSKTAKAALGFKEIAGYLDGEYDLEKARELIKMNTRRFAKRQLTWFNADKRISWFDVHRTSEAAIIKKIGGMHGTRAHCNR
jgi:tRNA dimethylallyltransferase